MGKRGFVPDRLVSANREDSERPEIGMPCSRTSPHTQHTWQYSSTGWCACPGVEWTPVYDKVLEERAVAWALERRMQELYGHFWIQS